MKPDTIEINKLVDLYRSKKFTEAKLLALELTKKFPNFSMAWKVLGSINMSDNEFDLAEKAYSKAIEIDPSDSDAHCNYGNIQLGIKNYEKARISYIKALEINKNYAEVYDNLGIVLRHEKKYEGAILNHKRAFKIKPNYHNAIYNLGITFMQMGNISAAELSFLKVLEMDGSNKNAKKQIKYIKKLKKRSKDN